MPAEVDDCVTFSADLPDDAGDDPDLHPGGSGLMRRLASELRAGGFEVSEVEQHSHYGWAFHVDVGAVSVWCMVQGHDEPNEWVLQTEAGTGIIDALFRRMDCAGTHRRVNAAIDAVLHQPPFSSATWMTTAEYDRR